jgi:hypothetical protein
MKFDPKSDAELYKMLAKGEYDFEVTQAEDTHSKSSGKEMLKLTLKVFGPDKEHILNDYIVDGAKLKRFCQAIGMDAAYESGELPADVLVGQGGRCKVDIEQSEQYGDRNKIAGYVARKSDKPKDHIIQGVDPQQTRAANKRTAEAMSGGNEDDSVPF